MAAGEVALDSKAALGLVISFKAIWKTQQHVHKHGSGLVQEPGTGDRAEDGTTPGSRWVELMPRRRLL